MTREAGHYRHRTVLPGHQDWMDQARCARILDTDWQYSDMVFFPEDSGTHLAARRRLAEARYHCGRCPVMRECLSYCLELESEFGPQEGVWAGTTPAEREHARKESA